LYKINCYFQVLISPLKLKKVSQFTKAAELLYRAAIKFSPLRRRSSSETRSFSGTKAKGVRFFYHEGHEEHEGF